MQVKRPYQHHALKTWPVFFEEIQAMRKPFEIRKNDRDYQVGDLLLLEEWDPKTGDYTGRKEEAKISYMTDFQQSDDMVVLGLDFGLGEFLKKEHRITEMEVELLTLRRSEGAGGLNPFIRSAKSRLSRITAALRLSA